MVEADAHENHPSDRGRNVSKEVTLTSVIVYSSPEDREGWPDVCLDIQRYRSLFRAGFSLPLNLRLDLNIGHNHGA